MIYYSENDIWRFFFMADWILRFVKGIFVGSGFILPGVSGGALAAVFGIYERMISFVAHLTRNFKENVLFFIPVGLGAVSGIFVFSSVVEFVLAQYESYVLWFFIGCILGTIPVLWQQAGKKGRSGKHYGILVVAFAASLAFLLFGEKLIPDGVAQNFGTWTLAGALIGLGMIVPGLSPSNFLLYMGMYESMAGGIRKGDLGIIIPIFVGLVGCVLLFSKLMDKVFEKAYAGLFHVILGIVFSSTLMIIPRNFNYLSTGTIVCVVLCAAGAALGYWMGSLEKKYKPAD